MDLYAREVLLSILQYFILLLSLHNTALSSSRKLKHYIYSRLRLDVAFKTKHNVSDKRSIGTIITVIFNSKVYKNGFTNQCKYM